MRSLWAERRALEAPADSVGEWVHRQLMASWAQWQRVLNAVLRGPVGTAARRVLSLFRGFRLKAPANADATKSLPTRTVTDAS
jgi:hypothetical protein